MWQAVANVGRLGLIAAIALATSAAHAAPDGEPAPTTPPHPEPTAPPTAPTPPSPTAPVPIGEAAQPEPTEPATAQPEPTSAPPTAPVHEPSAFAHAEQTSGLDVLPLDHAGATAEGEFEHADGSNTIALIGGARVALGRSGFVDLMLPVGLNAPANAATLGNATARIGYLFADAFTGGIRLAALAVRVSAPTSPAVGDGAQTAAALALPRVADGELFLPDTASAELLADWRWSRPTWWLQAEGGAAAWSQPAHATDGVLRLSFAGGVPVEPWLELTASLVNRSFLLAHGAPENFTHTFALGIVAHNCRGQLALRLEVPVDRAARADDRFVVGLELRGR